MTGLRLRFYIEGVGVWSPHLAGFPALCEVLAGATPAPPAKAPIAAILPPAERRRAPACVHLALEVAQQAAAASGRELGMLPCVFASSHGDQATTDYMCATLAREPLELSPTRFHNSVHNAPAGYWTIAVGCRAASSAVSAGRASFGAGLLEAGSQALGNDEAVLLACADTVGAGPMYEVTDCHEAFGSALVLSPARGAHTLARVDLQLIPAHPAYPEPPLPEPLASWRSNNPSAPALALLALLAQGAGHCQLAAAPALGLHIDLERMP
ncbi:MAG: beta-ketoacyl synthase chain length factor [Xanthomonadales bacterium]|nr:beta-ketoacyl synthase chain length factor [Xanthomonadales bacterium]